MPDDLIPSPAEKPDEEATESSHSQAKDRRADDEPPKRPKAARRPAPPLPDPAELVEQLRNVAGLVTLGILTPARANVAVRCISKTSDIVLKCQTATPGAPNEPELVEACRENPKLVGLLQSLLSDEQVVELLRQVDGDGV